jgi:hypothetical protein
MAIHLSAQSMRREALLEMMKVAEYCVTFRKDPQEWGSVGCYGYPAALILLSIADAIGSCVIGGNAIKHFHILNDPKYYNLHLPEDIIEKLFYGKYRSALSHNAILGSHDADSSVALAVGNPDSPVFEVRDGRPYLNLLPFLQLTQKVVTNFLNDEQHQ